MKLKHFNRFVDNVAGSKILKPELKTDLMKLGAIVFVADCLGISMREEIDKFLMEVKK